MTARNQPCPCGSGRKFKHCHGTPGAASSGLAAGSAQDLLTQARTALDQGDFSTAIDMGRRLPGGLPRIELLVRAYLARRQPADLKRAGKLIREWQGLDSRAAEPCFRAVELALLQESTSDAKTAVSAAARRAPEAALTHYYRGIVDQLEGNLEQALQSYRRAVSADSQFPLTEAELRLEAAIEAFETAAGEYPGSPAKDETGLVDRAQEHDELRDAISAWYEGWHADRAPLPAERATRYGNAWYNLGCTTMADFGRIPEGLEQFERAAEVQSDHELARLNAAFLLNYSDRHGPDDLFRAHHEMGTWLRRRHGPAATGFRNQAVPERRLRVGYLSSDFRNHSVAHFITPVLEAHDAEAFEVHAYYTDRRNDEYTRRAQRAVHAFHAVGELTDAALLEKIRADGLDILVDLNGLTRNHRVDVLVRRAAPVQVAWIGYPNTTGIDSMDYRIVDNLTDPSGQADERHVEQLVRLDGPFSAYEPPPQLPDPAGSLPARSNGHVTFGSFNHLPKLSPTLLDAWAEILRRVPDARMLVKSMVLDYHRPRERLLESMANRGIERSRIELVGRTRDKNDHLSYYNRVDLCLDSYPYNGTTTTCDSLAMAVPVLTLAGEDHRSRVGLSQLTALGLESLVTTDKNGYVERAVELAGDPDELEQLRSGLRERLMASPLADVRQLTRQVERAYKKIWTAWCESARQEAN